MKLIIANPVSSLAVPLLLAVALHGCQSTGGEKGTTEQASKQASNAQAIKSLPDSGSVLSRIPELKFDVDPTLLGLSYEDSTLGIRFSPPRGWPPLEPAMMEQTKQAYEKFTGTQSDDQFVSKPVRMFYNKDKRYFMILSDFTAWPAPVDPIAKMEEYRQRVAARNPGSVLQYGMTRHGNLGLFQMLMTNQIVADLRVVVIREGRVPVQIDYLVPQQLYSDLTKGIEASVGSIQPL
jgi:hypothetical protein